MKKKKKKIKKIGNFTYPMTYDEDIILKIRRQ